MRRFWQVIGLTALTLTSPLVLAKTLTIYTYDAFTADWGPGPAIKTAFEKECDCTLNWVALDSSVGILNRLQMEGTQSSADLVLGLDHSTMERASQSGLFAAHGQDTGTLNLPLTWTDETFLPFDYGYFAFVYDQRRLENPPTSMAELLERKDLSLVYQDPRTSTPGLGLLLWLQSLYGDEMTTAFKRLNQQSLTVTRSWSEAYGLFLQGEADLVLSYSTSPAYHALAEQDPNFHAALFPEGHYLQVEVAALLKHAQEPELAREFLAFMLSPAFQQKIPTGNWMYPVIADIALPEGFPEPPATNALLIPAPEIEPQRRTWINQWLDAVSE